MATNKLIIKIATLTVLVSSLLYNGSVYSNPGPPKLSNAEFKEKFDVATEYFAYQYYAEAMTYFQSLLQSDPNNCNINFYVGVCILNSIGKRTQAIPYLEKAVKKTNVSYGASHREESAPVHALYYLGQAYLIDNRVDDAIAMFTKFKTFLTPKDEKLLEDANWQLKITDNALHFAQNIQKNVLLESIADANSTFSDLSPVINSDGSILYFSSRRKTSGDKDNLGQYPADIYYIELKAGKWGKAKKMSGKTNTDKVDELCSISADGNRMYIQRTTNIGTFDLYCSAIGKKGKWQNPEKLPASINTKFNEESAFESKDGLKLYFVSDKDGGFGGKDIWVCEKDARGDWGVPYNLGSTVNTVYDETTPSILNDDATLYFSSKGHNTMGGYDIFISTLSDDGLWSKPENMGCPLNSTSDDVCYKESKDGKSAYFSTAKKGGWGELDVFKVIFK